MKYIDLHVHSNKSDGTLSPSSLVDEAIKAGLVAIALTDHDTVSGVYEAEETALSYKKAGNSIRIVSGVELSASYKEKEVHILGLLIDYNNDSLLDTLNKLKKNRENRSHLMISKFKEAGIHIDFQDLCQDEPETIITRAHFARFLTEHHYAKDTLDAFKRYLGYDSPFYVSHPYLSLEHVIYIIKKAGGIPILAHPLLYKFTLTQVEELISFLTSLGIVGIEAIYSLNTGFEEGILRRLANKYHLLITGGSDFHGRNKPHIKLGVGKGNLLIPLSVLEKLDNYKQLLH